MKNDNVYRIKTICRGDRHTILLKNGKLGFPDHDMKQERAFAVLGNECRCLEVLQAWREGRTGKLPILLREKLIERIAVQTLRHNKSELEASMEYGPVPFAAFKDRYRRETYDKLFSILRNQTRYPAARYALQTGVTVDSFPPVFRIKDKRVDLNVGWMWLRSINDFGDTTIDGYLIAKVVSKNPWRLLIFEKPNEPPRLVGVNEATSRFQERIIWL